MSVPVPVPAACCFLEGGRHAGEAEDGMHLRVHRHGLTAAAHFGAVVVESVVVVTARDDFPPLTLTSTTPSVKHIWALSWSPRRRSEREVELRLVHF